MIAGNVDGSPRTPREPNGLPVIGPQPCVLGGTSNLVAVSGNTFKLERSPRGTLINKLVTPRLTSVVRDLLGCPTLDGVKQRANHAH